mgnify:CR=1 FL=1
MSMVRPGRLGSCWALPSRNTTPRSICWTTRALVAHAKVAEAAVVGYPHDIKGTGIYAYVTLVVGEEPGGALEQELRQQVRTEIGPIATPDLLHFTPALPKTRSGKIMRRILRKIAENDFANLGDTSTLAEPALVDNLIEGRRNR